MGHAGQGALLVQLTAQVPLNLAAGGERQRGGPEQQNFGERHPMLQGHRFTHGPEDGLLGQGGQLGALHLLNDNHPFLAIKASGEGRAPIGRQGWVAELNGGFQILGVVVLAITGGEAKYADIGHFTAHTDTPLR